MSEGRRFKAQMPVLRQSNVKDKPWCSVQTTRAAPSSRQFYRARGKAADDQAGVVTAVPRLRTSDCALC